MDYDEEQRNELEALEAIFGADFTLIQSDPPRSFELVLVPNADGVDNHVSLRLLVDYPPTYPTVPANIQLRNEKGLRERQLQELQTILEERSEAEKGEVAIYTIAEGLKEYLVAHNQPELSMHEEMAQRVQARDLEEEERVAKRKALEERIEAKKKEPSPLGILPGTILTPETFKHWRDMFDAEQKALREIRDAAKPQTTRLTGKQLFQQNLAKELDDGDAEKLELVEEEIKEEPPVFFDASLYVDDDEGEGIDEEAKKLALDDHDDDDEPDHTEEEESKLSYNTASIAVPPKSSTTATSSSSTASSTPPVAAKPTHSSGPPGFKTAPPSTASSSTSTAKPPPATKSAAVPPSKSTPASSTATSSSASSAKSNPKQAIQPTSSKNSQSGHQPSGGKQKDGPKQQQTTQQQKGGKANEGKKK